MDYEKWEKEKYLGFGIICGIVYTLLGLGIIYTISF